MTESAIQPALKHTPDTFSVSSSPAQHYLLFNMQIKNAVEFIMAKRNKLIQLARYLVCKNKRTAVRGEGLVGREGGPSQPHFIVVSALSTATTTQELLFSYRRGHGELQWVVKFAALTGRKWEECEEECWKLAKQEIDLGMSWARVGELITKFS